MTAMGPDNEVVETEYRAVPAGDGERVVAAHEQVVARRRRRRLAGVGDLVAVTLGVAALAGPPEGPVAVVGLAVLLAYGVLIEPRTEARLFAPEVVRTGVPREVAEAEAVTVVEEPFRSDVAATPDATDPPEEGRRRAP